MGKEVPAKAAAPSGDSLISLTAVGQASAVAPQHLDIGQKMMTESHRLGRLQVRIARHDRGCLGLGLADQRRLKVPHLRVQGIDGAAQPEPEVGCHLVVAAARRVQTARRRADQLGQPGLDVHVDVFEGGGEGEGPALDLLKNLL